jgi:Outer membrane protein beta-barrel domain
MYHLLRKQIVLLLSIVFSISVTAQQELNRPFHDDMPYYFGLTLNYNSSFLHASKSNYFLNNDSILSAYAGTTGGIGLGLLGTLKLNDNFQLRFNPQLIIGASRYFNYVLGLPAAGESINQQKVLPTTLVSFPLHVKFNSDRIGNFRSYLLGGVKYDMDLASNSSARNADDLIKLKAGDFGVEIGIGFNLFLPFVTLSPEIKYSLGITNLHQYDASLKYSNVFDKIQSRMIVFSLHFED